MVGHRSVAVVEGTQAVDIVVAVPLSLDVALAAMVVVVVVGAVDAHYPPVDDGLQAFLAVFGLPAVAVVVAVVVSVVA